MKHKLTYSILLSLVLLFSFDLALAQNVSVVGTDTDLHPNTVYCYDIVLDDGTGITAFTLPVDVAGAGFVSGTMTVTLGAATVSSIVGDQVLLGYSGADLGAGPITLANICVTTGGTCGETLTIDTGVMAPAGSMRFAGACFQPSIAFGAFVATLYNGTPTCDANVDVDLVCGGSIVDKQINATEPIGLDLEFTMGSGPGAVTIDGLYSYTPDPASCDMTELVEITVTNPCGNSATCSFNVNYDQEAPVLTVSADQSEHWLGGAVVYANPATDDGCPAPSNLVYSIVSVVPAVASIGIDITNGDITFDPDCADLGIHIVTVMVTDGCESDTDTFNIEVTNTVPTVVCPPDVALWYSYMGAITGDGSANDGNGDATTVDFFEFLKDGVPVANPGMTIDADGTNFVWDPDWMDEGDWEVTLEVDDGCQQGYCTFNMTVLGKFFLCMDSVSVLSGLNATVILNVSNSMAVGGYDFVISYDPTMAFMNATPIGILADWEYFTYRMSEEDNCGGGCPTGVLRLIGIANMPDGNTPDESVFHPEGGIVELTFATPADLSFIGQCFHLSWTWYDCGDNTMSSRSGDTLFMAQNIGGILDGCLDGDKGYVPEPRINFCDGIICIVPPVDDRGDINLNGVANEISDAVIYANYFIYGPEVLGYGIDQYYPNRVLASDINDDGIPLTVADLVYLIRIITGDANPYPESGEGKITPYANSADIVAKTDGQMLTVSSYSSEGVGAAAFVFRHTGMEIGTPVLTDEASEMTIRSSNKNGELRILVYSMNGNGVTAGANDLFTVPVTGNGTIEMADVQVSDSFGGMLAVDMHRLSPPTSYELMQNYPNPFNASTAIRFALINASDWSLSIYNVAGQLVDEFTGRDEAGTITVKWNADVASGVYFYKLTTDNFTDTKKMILMK